MQTHTRRRLLSLFASAGLAGCAGRDAPTADTARDGKSSPTEAPSTRSPTPTETTTPVDLSVTHDRTAWSRYDPDWEASSDPPGAVRAEVLVENLEVPWDVSVAPTGEVFLTERVGRVLRYDAGELSQVAAPADAINAGSIPPGGDNEGWWVDGGEGGTLGVAVHPAYPDPPLVYVYYTVDVEGSTYNRVAYFDVSADGPDRRGATLIDRIPANKFHNGGRIAFGPSNYLWVLTGDAGEEPLAQDRGSLAGKVLRVTPAGDPAPDNPDLGADADPRVYTFGHRNPQGIAWLPDGRAVLTEHGPGPDEVSLLTAGGNYGWPRARSAEEYRESEYLPPLASSGNTTWAPSGCVFYTGDGVPSWRNRLVVGGLGSQRVKTFTLTRPEGSPPPRDGGTRFDADWLDDRLTATGHDALTDELGRVRLVQQGPAGGLYAITSNRDGRARGSFPTERDDALVRLVPEDDNG